MTETDGDIENDTTPYPLHRACFNGDVQRVKVLLSQGYSVNETTFDLVQPLHWACFKGHAEIVKLLINAGADVNCRNIDSSTPLCDACCSGQEECVQILLEAGAYVNPQLLLSSPLHEAVLRDRCRCAELLIQAGASLEQSDCHFGTPLHASVCKGSVNCVKVLLKAGCKVDSLQIMSTPLHFAATLQDEAIVELLLEFGGNPCKTDNYDRTPRDLVPSTASRVRKILLRSEKNPKRLKFQCRTVIRRCAGRSGLALLAKLKLPKFLYDYVTYTHI